MCVSVCDMKRGCVVSYSRASRTIQPAVTKEVQQQQQQLNAALVPPDDNGSKNQPQIPKDELQTAARLHEEAHQCVS